MDRRDSDVPMSKKGRVDEEYAARREEYMRYKRRQEEMFVDISFVFS